MPTPSQQQVNDLIACFQVMQSVAVQQDEVSGISTLNSTTPFGNFLANMATCAMNADGTPGAADASPNESHPIDIRVYSGLPIYATATQWAQILAGALAVGSFAAGSAIAANGAMPGIIALVKQQP